MGGTGLRFLLKERKFPRAVFHSICEVEECLQSLPRNQESVASIQTLKNNLLNIDPDKLTQADLHDFLDKLQMGLINTNNAITNTYFRSQL